MQFRRAFERSAKRGTQPAARVDFGAARWTLREMPQDVVRGLDQELLAQERVGELSDATAFHGAFVLAAALRARAGL